jgi:hypothetical protein
LRRPDRRIAAEQPPSIQRLEPCRAELPEGFLELLVGRLGEMSACLLAAPKVRLQLFGRCRVDRHSQLVAEGEAIEAR